MRKTALILGILSVIFFAAPAFGQQNSGITVIPSIMHIDLAQDPPEYELTYFNNTNTEIGLKLTVQDFDELENSYRINFLQGKDAANYQYSLSSWISFENSNLIIEPGEKKSVTVFIDKQRITKGGHYASILAEIQQPQTKQINVKEVLSSLLFVRSATGKEYEEGKIENFEPLRGGIEYPDSFVLRFENSGNVFVTPYGLIQIYDPLGNLVAKGQVNQDSLDALPESIRNYVIPVTNYQKVLLPGIYTATISIHFGKTDQKLNTSVRFFSQGMFDFVKIFLILLGLIVIAIYLRKRIDNHKAS